MGRLEGAACHLGVPAPHSSTAGPLFYLAVLYNKAKTEVSAPRSPPWLHHGSPVSRLVWQPRGNSDSGVWPQVLQPCPGGWARASLGLMCGLQPSIHAMWPGALPSHGRRFTG